MAGSSLASAFRAGNGRKIKWQGKTVYSLVQMAVKEGDTITITRTSSSNTRAQALKVAPDKGELRANGVVTPVAAIWTHTSPTQVALEVVGRRVRTIDIWNSWSLDGVDSSWLGNAGITVDKDGDARVLHCSDGVGTASFDDLIVRIEVQNG